MQTPAEYKQNKTWTNYATGQISLGIVSVLDLQHPREGRVATPLEDKVPSHVSHQHLLSFQQLDPDAAAALAT